MKTNNKFLEYQKNISKTQSMDTIRMMYHASGGLPDTEWLGEIFLIIHAIKSKPKNSLLRKLKHSMNKKDAFPPKTINHLDGSAIGILNPQPEVRQLVSKLSYDPKSNDHRINLIHKIISTTKDDNNLAKYKTILIQSMLPFYLGNFGFDSINIALFAHHVYLDKFCTYIKHRIIEFRSPQLTNVTLRKVKLTKTRSDSLMEQKLQQRLSIAEKMKKQTKVSLKLLKAQVTEDYSMDDVDQFFRKCQQVEKENYKSHSKLEIQDFNRNKKLVFKSIVHVINCLKPIPFFHPMCLKLSEKMIEVDPSWNIGYLLKGRIYMKAVKEYLRRVEIGDLSCKEDITPTFNKSVVFYRKALKRTPMETASIKDLPVLVEFASLARFAFMRRSAIQFTREGLKDFIVEGNKAIDSAVLIESRYTPIQHILHQYLTALKRV